MNIIVYLDAVQSIFSNETNEKLGNENRNLIGKARNLAKKHNGTITAIMIGEQKNQNLLREALARGCDHAILLEGLPNISNAYIAAAWIHQLKYDVILTGDRVLDGFSTYMGAQIGTLLKLPTFSFVVEPEFRETCVFTIQNTEVEEELMSVMAINEAYNKSLDFVSSTQVKDIVLDVFGNEGVEKWNEIHSIKEVSADFSRKCQLVDCVPSEECEHPVSVQTAVEQMVHFLESEGVKL